MASQRDIRRRIGAVRNIKQITRAMQFVAASKMKRAQDSALATRPYREMIEAMKITHRQLHGVHSGRIPPFDAKPRAQ